MNEFVEQFLLESRELIEQASGDLLGLEDDPADQSRLDSAFRAFHTLKGAAGIVDFAAMARALHAAEDVLSGVRAGEAAVSGSLIGACLSCLDQVVQWLDAMESEGEAPADADEAADAVVARFAAVGRVPRPTEPLVAASAWIDDLRVAHAAAFARAGVAVRYAPDADCFFRGEDPLAAVEAMPGLLALDFVAGRPWPPLAAFDPFTCNLVLVALGEAPVETVSSHFAARRARVDIQPLTEPPTNAASHGLSDHARLLLGAQIQLLQATDEVGAQGRRGAAGRVAVNILRHAGLEAGAERLERVAATASAAALMAAISAVLDGSPVEESAAPDPAPAKAEAPVRVLRVDAERIESLVRLTGELTVVANALGHTASLARQGVGSGALAAAMKDQHARLERLVAQLRQSVIAVRVLPFRHVFQRFPRLVREMAASIGKDVRLVVEGDAIEADKAVVEALFEPLLHIVRNAADHGVESGAARAAAGKAPVATIHLRATRQGGHVLVEVEDDGGGVDIARVRRVAAERGVATPEALMAMSDQEAIELIFAPGFSTAPDVTDLSGRGVGMDVVRTAIERVGGRVTMESRSGLGATVRLLLPISIMLTRLLTVEAGGQAFGIPMDAVVETLRISRDRIVPVGAARAVVLRNQTLPVVDLAEALGEAHIQAPERDVTVVVVDIEGHLGCLEVDRLGEPLDAMLKPMDGILSATSGVAGATLLGDGRVLIVLDLRELLR